MPKVLTSRPADSASSKGSSLVIKWSNLGKGRTVDHKIKVHRSVRTRISIDGVEGNGCNYWPQIRFNIGGKMERLDRDRWLEGSEHFEWVGDAKVDGESTYDTREQEPRGGF